MTGFTFKSIGYVQSCFKEKFGIPRQPGLAPDATAVINIIPPFDRAEAFRELERFSHIWVIFVFHQNLDKEWRTTVRPPRLGGNQRVGVFASRSGFRPNPIGQSAVVLKSIETGEEGIRLFITGVDLLDGTPVLDIKPYVPYADSRPEAIGGYACAQPETPRPVVFSEPAQSTCKAIEKTHHPNLARLITDLLAQDPRPGYENAPSQRLHGVRLWNLDVKFQVSERQIEVVAIEPVVPDRS